MMRLDYETHKAPLFERMGYRPHPGQELVHRSNAKTRTVCCGRRFGKSFLAAAEAVACAILGGGVWCVAPNYDLSSIVFDEALNFVINSPAIASMLAHEPRTSRGNQVMLFKSGGWIIGKSSHKPQTLLGRGIDFLPFDEAATEDNEDLYPQYIRPVLLDRLGSFMPISTPRGDNWFKELFDRGDCLAPGFASFRMPSFSNPRLTDTPEGRRELLEMKRDLPRDFYEQEVLAVFLDAIGALFRHYAAVCTVEEMYDSPDPECSYVLGVDLGRHHDFTVITVIEIETMRTVYGERFTNLDWDFIESRVARTSQLFGAPVLVDSTGVGDRSLEAIRKLVDWVPVEGFVFNEQSKLNLMRQLAVSIEHKEVSLFSRDIAAPSHLEFDMLAFGRNVAREMSAYRYEKTKSGKLKMGAPPGKHDDIPTSIALALQAARIWGGYGLGSAMRATPAVTHAEILERAEEKPKLAGTYSRPNRGRDGKRRRLRGL